MKSWPLILTLLLPGCAAMVRSWSFIATPVRVDAARLEVREVAVRMDTVTVTARLILDVQAPTPVDLGVPLLTWRTQQLEGTARVLERQGPLAWIGATDQAKVLEGEELLIRLNFRSVGRDMRRNLRYGVTLPDLHVGGQRLALPEIRLRAPDDAPIVETD